MCIRAPWSAGIVDRQTSRRTCEKNLRGRETATGVAVTGAIRKLESTSENLRGRGVRMRAITGTAATCMISRRSRSRSQGRCASGGRFHLGSRNIWTIEQECRHSAIPEKLPATCRFRESFRSAGGTRRSLSCMGASSSENLPFVRADGSGRDVLGNQHTQFAVMQGGRKALRRSSPRNRPNRNCRCPGLTQSRHEPALRGLAGPRRRACAIGWPLILADTRPAGKQCVR